MGPGGKATHVGGICDTIKLKKMLKFWILEQKKLHRDVGNNEEKTKTPTQEKNTSHLGKGEK